MSIVQNFPQITCKRVHTLFVLCAREQVCAISLGWHNLELRFANKRATSLPGVGETEYTQQTQKIRSYFGNHWFRSYRDAKF